MLHSSFNFREQRYYVSKFFRRCGLFDGYREPEEADYFNSQGTFINSVKFIAGVEYELKSKKSIQFEYDNNGNRTKKVTTYQDIGKIVEQAYTYHPNSNRLKNDGTYNYEYDDDGNLRRRYNDYVDYRYNWNLENRLESVDLRQYRFGWNETWEGNLSPEDLGRFLRIFEAKYDEGGRRYWKWAKQVDGTVKESRYAYTSFGLLYEETNSGGTTTKKSYIYGEGKKLAEVKGSLDMATATDGTVTGFDASIISYTVCDQLGSTRLLVNQAGAVLWYAEYEPFGDTSYEESRAGGTSTDQTFTSYTRDVEIGLQYAMARYYQSDMGRFITEDPAKDGANWYVYVGNNPLRFVDPSGLYVVYTPSGRTEYFTRDDPVRETLLDSRYKFSPHMNSCKTGTIINSYLADGETVISDKQLDQIILNQDGSIKPSIDVDGSPLDGNIISQDTARALGLTEYNKLEESSYIDSSKPAIVEMNNSRTDHYVYRDSEGQIDVLPPNRPSASTYVDIEQNTITKTLLPEVQKKREEEQRMREEMERRIEQSQRAEESRQLEEAKKQVDAMKEEAQSEGTQSETETSPKIICAELYRQGKMDEDIYRVDEQFGVWLKKYMPLVLDGYHAWAKPIVREMRKSEAFTDTVQRIAEPWTYEMAYLMGEREQGNLIGALEMFIGIPLCALIGLCMHPLFLGICIILLLGIIWARKLLPELSAKEKLRHE